MHFRIRIVYSEYAWYSPDEPDVFINEKFIDGPGKWLQPTDLMDADDLDEI